MGNTDKRVYFYLIPAHREAFQHLAICLAEGLVELGYEVYSNIDYWLLSVDKEDYLIRHNPTIAPDDCSIVVLNQDWFLYGEPFPDNLFHTGRKYKTVYLDRQDGSKTYSWNSEFRQFDRVLKTHFNRNFWYPSNFRPWAFGISKRIVKSTESTTKFEDRKRQLLVNFRDKKNNKYSTHSVRLTFYKDFLPLASKAMLIDSSIDNYSEPPEGSNEYLLWLQTGGRHYENYYQRLQGSMFCACLGGYFESPIFKDKSTRLSRLQKRLLFDLGIKTRWVSQWDSWRFWESLAAGCVTIHLDFEKYGMVLPNMPQNWKHYIGIDLNRPKEAIDRMMDEPETLARIALEGRCWAIEHYSPVATALRFLSMLKEN